MKLKESKITSKLLYDGKIMKVFLDDVRLPDGEKSKREYIRHCGGAAVLFIKDGCVALVKQYRYAYATEMYEIPAGRIDEGEEPETAAIRELEEETGYRAAKVEKLFEIYPSPGYTDEIIHIYKVIQADFVGEKLDEGEFLNCEFIPLKKVVKMIEKRDICDAKTVCAIYKYIADNSILTE